MIDIQSFTAYCSSKPGVTEHFPFDEDTLVFKVGGKVFALTSLRAWEEGCPRVNLKCDPERAMQLRVEFEGIGSGYHMSKVHWNTVAVNADVPDKLVKELTDHSYDLVFSGLPKKVRAAFTQE